MMKNNYIMLVSIAQILISLQLRADHVITFFIRPYPYAQNTQSPKRLLKKLHKPGKLAKCHLKQLSHLAPTAGIFSSYAGFMDMSDRIGQITFPLKQDDAALSFVIANRITPMLMAGNTIHHWEIPEGTKAAQYSVTRMQDQQTGLWYWHVEKKAIPKDRILPVTSILIFAKPKNIFIPEGITLTTDSPNFVLPTIYSRKNMNILANALFVLNNRQFFASGVPKAKLDGKMIQMHQIY